MAGRATALLGRAGVGRARAGAAAGAARAVLVRALAKMPSDRLEIVDVDGSVSTFGSSATADSGDLAATVRIEDARAWTAVATEGSIGLGRGYIEGWWTSDDPVSVVRIIIRNLIGLDGWRNRIEAVGGPVNDRVRALLPRPGRKTNREDIASHYDLGNEFFATFLDETMTYSAAVLPSPEATLLAGSLAKYDRLLAKLAVDAESDVLELGSGWGGFAIRAAATAGCRVTTTTVSVEQERAAIDRVEAEGLRERVTVLGRDWRDLTGTYDRIVSIEMIEAVHWRDYDRFFATLGRCLAPDGLIGLQAICVPDQRYDRTKKTEDFIRRFVFPGGYLPSLGAITRSSAAAGLQVIDVEDLSAHYAETLLRWRRRFEARLDDVRALGLDDRFCRLWHFYLAYCEAGFRERHCTVDQIVLAGPRWRPDGLALRPC